MYVNNETGVIQPLKAIANICHENDVMLFSDATQAVGKMPIDLNDLQIDLMCFSGHKFYGPKGIGGLFVRKGLKLEPLIHGGGHENGLRSGTLNVPAIVGLAKAFELSFNEKESNEKLIKALRDKFEKALLSTKKIRLNGNSKFRLYNVSNITFLDIDPFLINSSLKNVAFSQGSACNSNSIKPSHVLKAMGIFDKEALSSFRFSFGKFNSDEEIQFVLNIFYKLLNTNLILKEV